MSVPVFTWPYSADGFRVKRNSDVVVVELGDGYIRSALKSASWDHQDGTGGADTSHAGYSTFTVTMPPTAYGGSTFTQVLDFLQARLDNGCEAFYLYDPNVTPDSANWDGTTTTGRHLVKHFEGKIGWRMMHRQFCQFEPFVFREVHP